MCQIRSSVGPRPCRAEMLPPITVKSQRPDDPLPHPRQCCDRRPSHPNQFAVSCPIYLHEYTPIYIRCIVFTCHVCIPEHYHYSLMRSMRDVDLHRPTTRRRRCFELPNPTVHIPVRGTSVSCPQHTPNQHMPVVAYNETTTAETPYII